MERLQDAFTNIQISASVGVDRMRLRDLDLDKL